MTAHAPLTYSSYLHLRDILSAQAPLSGEHDEMLFIIIHQASELWMKLCLHELIAARQNINGDHLGPAFKMIARVARIQAQLIQSWDVLATMTPSDYSAIRPKLASSSGFQSYQYRLLEFLMGNKDPAMVDIHRHDARAARALAAMLNEPSIYDESLRLLAKRGFDIPPEKRERDWSERYEPDARVEQAWLEVYRDPDAHWDLYELAEKLVDLEYRFQQWRFVHMKTVERIIGDKRGTVEPRACPISPRSSISASSPSSSSYVRCCDCDGLVPRNGHLALAGSVVPSPLRGGLGWGSRDAKPVCPSPTAEPDRCREATVARAALSEE